MFSLILFLQFVSMTNLSVLQGVSHLAAGRTLDMEVHFGWDNQGNLAQTRNLGQGKRAPYYLLDMATGYVAKHIGYIFGGSLNIF